MASAIETNETEAIHFHAKLDWPEFLVLMKRPIRNWSDHLFRAAFRGLPIIFAVGAFAGTEHVDLIFCIACFVVSFFSIWFFIPWFYRWQTKKSFTTVEIKGQFSPVGTIVTTETAYASVPWESLLGYRMLGNTLLIHSTREACYMLPPGAFANEGDRDRALQLIRSKLPTATSRSVTMQQHLPALANELRYRSIPDEFTMVHEQGGVAYRGCIGLTDHARAESLSVSQSAKDYERSTRRMSQLRFWLRTGMNGMIWLVIAAVFIPPVLLGTAFGIGSAAGLFVLMFFALVGPWMWIARVRMLLRTRRRWREQHGIIGEHGIVTDDDREVSILAWEGFSGFRAGNDMLIIYNSDVTYLTYPRSFFANDHDWQLAIHYAASNTPDLMPKGSLIHIPDVPACSECGIPEDDAEMLHFGKDLVCASCKDTYIQKLREGVDVDNET